MKRDCCQANLLHCSVVWWLCRLSILRVVHDALFERRFFDFAILYGYIENGEHPHRTAYCVRCLIVLSPIWVELLNKPYFRCFQKSCVFVLIFAVLPECRSCLGISPRRSPALVRSYHSGTSPVGISHSDGHSVFKVRLIAYRYILAKKDALSRISKRMEMRNKRAKNLRLWTKA